MKLKILTQIMLGTLGGLIIAGLMNTPKTELLSHLSFGIIGCGVSSLPLIIYISFFKPELKGEELGFFGYYTVNYTRQYLKTNLIGNYIINLSKRLFKIR